MIKLYIKKKAFVTLVFFMLFYSSCCYVRAYANAPSYNYSYWNEAVAAPDAYYAIAVVNGDQIGVGPLEEPNDIYVTQDREIYISDSGNNRIIITDSNFNCNTVIDSFLNEGQIDSFLNPQGIFVTADKHLYIADTDNHRIVHLDRNYELVMIIESPESELFHSTFEFNPAKLVVDKAGRIFVMAIGVFDGFMEFNAHGEFSTFIGANRVYVNPIEYLWKLLSTREQRSRMVQFTPTEFMNLDIDREGFIYAVNADQSGENIKKLNAHGTDILRREGYTDPCGDTRYRYIDGPSRLIDIDVADCGIYSVLDSKRGRIFTYNNDGYLLYVFGGLGNTVGEFNTPRAIERLGDKFLVLDRALGEITVFETTEYGHVLNEAVISYYRGDTEKAAGLFFQAVNLNANLEYAYNGIGKALLRQGDYYEAAEYFKRSFSRENFSKAFLLYRKEVMRNHFSTVMTCIAIAAICIYLIKVYTRKRHKKGGAFIGH